MFLLRHLLLGLLMPTMLTLLCVIIAIRTKRRRFGVAPGFVDT